MAPFHVARISLVLATIVVLPAQGLMPVNINTKLEQRTPQLSNCAFGRVIPEFYVLGAKNSATTSLAVDLEHVGVWAAPQNTWKEWQFFFLHAGFPESQQFQMWLGELPFCGAKRRVVADFSVTNLFANELPADLTWSAQYGYTDQIPGPRRDPDVWSTARLISQFHSLVVGQGAKPPKFVVMLRDPLGRTQSEYYHTLPLQNCRGCMAKDNFVDSFKVNVDLLSKKQMSDWFWKSFYARQIESFERYFNASQFMFVPDKEYYGFDPAGFSSELLAWLQLTDQQSWKEASHANEHVIKPPLDEELPPGHPAREAYQALMEPETQHLVQLLSRMQRQGAVLPGYNGTSSDIVALRSWLERGW